MLDSSETGLEKDQAKLPMLTEVFMMESGKMTKNTEMDNTNI